MTGQGIFDSYEYSGARVAVALVNELASARAAGRPPRRADAYGAIGSILAFDPATAALLRPEDTDGFVDLAERLRPVFEELGAADVDAAARRLNALLAAHPAHPHLAREDGRWRLHHHPAEAALVPMYTAICAEALARAVGEGAAGRIGVCGSDSCDRVYVDGSKNGSRRFCSTTCQNRVKAAAFRRRRAGP